MEFRAAVLHAAGQPLAIERVRTTSLKEERMRWCACGPPDAYRLSPEITRPGGDLVWLGKVNVNRLPLDRINDGYAAMARNEVVRAVVMFDD
jgi:Zn-dependent alcohol dehydrogenase